MKLVNAGLKSKDELVRRLIDGEVFYYEEDKKIFYDPVRKYIFASPFVYQSHDEKMPMSGIFDQWYMLKIEKKPDWKDDLEKCSILCKCTPLRGSYSCFALIDHINEHLNYVCVFGQQFKDATPVTPDMLWNPNAQDDDTKN